MASVNAFVSLLGGDPFFFLLFVLIEIVFTLWILKVSAKWAYGANASWGQAAIQWISIILLQIALVVVFAVLLGAFNIL